MFGSVATANSNAGTNLHANTDQNSNDHTFAKHHRDLTPTHRHPDIGSGGEPDP